MERTELSLYSNINGLKNLIESNTNELKEEIEDKVPDSEKYSFMDLRNDRKKLAPRTNEEIESVMFSI